MMLGRTFFLCAFRHPEPSHICRKRNIYSPLRTCPFQDCNIGLRLYVWALVTRPVTVRIHLSDTYRVHILQVHAPLSLLPLPNLYFREGFPLNGRKECSASNGETRWGRVGRAPYPCDLFVHSSLYSS